MIGNQRVIVLQVQELKGRARQDITAGLARLSDRFVSCRRLGEPVLQRIDSCQVVSHVVVAAPLPGGQPEFACGISPSGPGSTQMDHGGQVLLLLKRDRVFPSLSYRLGDLPIEQCRRQFDGMAR